MTLRVVNWNVAWATPRSERSPEILRRIAESCPDVICLTESDAGLLAQDGYTICAQPDFGQRVVNDRRKALLWSSKQWREVEDPGSKTLPPGRFVSGITNTELGETTVIGICIPWHNSRATGPTGTRRQWQDHREYIDGLAKILGRSSATPLIVMGDFNQRIGQGNYPPARLRAALQDAMSPRLTTVTAALGFRGRRAIDHIAISADLAAESLGVISNMPDDGKPLSDHFGVVAGLSTRNTPAETAIVE